MTRQKFNELVDERVEKTKETLKTKADEYSDNDNAFHNFDEAARIENTTPEDALWGMFLKHLVSVQDAIRSGNASNDFIEEKIGDSINYLHLLEGIFKRKL